MGDMTERLATLEADHRGLLRMINGQLGEIKTAVHEGREEVATLNRDFLKQPMRCMKMFEVKLVEVKRSTQWTVRRWLGIPAVLVAMIAVLGAIVAFVQNH